MKRAYFIDLDGVLVRQGTQEFLFGAKDKLLKIFDNPDNTVFFFSCWAFNDNDIRFLKENFPYKWGIIQKPLADEYVYIDDKLNVLECKTGLI